MNRKEEKIIFADDNDITDSDIDRIIEEIKRGNTIRGIAEDLGLPMKFVNYYWNKWRVLQNWGWKV